jgi:hypothetical protein
MKTRLILALLILTGVTFSSLSYGQKSSFSGEWKLNREKTVLADGQLFLSKVTLQLKGDSLLTTRVYEDSNGQEYPFNENVVLNGKDFKINIYDMPRSTKASRSATDGSLLVESVTTFYGNNGEENLISKETWRTDSEGKTLTVDFTNKMSAGEFSGTSYFTRVK